MSGLAVVQKQKPKRNLLWERASCLVSETQRIQSTNLSLVLYAQAYLWFHKIAQFRGAECSLIYRKKPNVWARSQHRRVLEVLIEEGLELLRRIRSNGGLIKKENGFSLEDIESTIEELKNTRLQWFGGMTKTRKAQILKNVFDAS
jgi:hypothetical protein